MPDAGNRPSVSPKTGDLYSLDAGDAWLQEAMETSARTRHMRQRAMIDNPQLVAYNANRLPEAPPEGVIPSDPRQGKLTIAPPLVSVPDDVTPADAPDLKIHNWLHVFNASLQFTQAYISSNWYQGGEKNYMGNLDVTLRANYNDQRKITWENTLDIQLGFQTTESDSLRVFRPNHNLLRYTTNAGYKAWKNWYYSLQVILKTQIAPTYQKNTDKITSEFLSPLEVTVAPGMKYEIKWGKKRPFTGQLNVAPLAMKVMYVMNDDLVKNYGIPEGKNQKTTFGPNITLNTRWQISKQISWTNRMYWMSNFDYNIWEWENTVEFIVTKLITTRFYFYPRFDNSNERYRTNSRFNTYMMFKEWLSAGLTYNF